MLAIPALAIASPFAGHGWFWYQMPPPPPRVRPTVPPPPTPAPVVTKPKKPAKPYLKPFSVQWIKKYRHKYMIKAINDPTPKNMETYMLINKAMFDKAQNFANAFYYQSHFNMALNPAVDYPHTEAGLDAYYAQEDAAKRKAFHYLSHHSGIFFFFSSNCPYCALQYQQLNFFLQHHPNFKKHTYYVSMDGKRLPNMPTSIHVFPNHGQAKFFKLAETPALVLALPPKTFVVFAQGETVDAEIHDQLLRAAVYYHLVPKNILDGLTPGRRGLITTKQFLRVSKHHKDRKLTQNQINRILDRDISQHFYSWG
jgi:conjugal transfer pilus assembly protein TraF